MSDFIHDLNHKNTDDGKIKSKKTPKKYYTQISKEGKI